METWKYSYITSLRHCHMPQPQKQDSKGLRKREKRPLCSPQWHWCMCVMIRLSCDWVTHQFVTILFELMKKKIYKMTTHCKVNTHTQAKADADTNRNSCFEALLPFWWPWGLRERLRFASIIAFICFSVMDTNTTPRGRDQTNGGGESSTVEQKLSLIIAPFLWSAQKTFMISITSLAPEREAGLMSNLQHMLWISGRKWGQKSKRSEDKKIHSTN